MANSIRKFISGGSIYGKLMLLIGTLLIVPCAVLPFYPGEAAHIGAFLLPALVSVGAGLAACRVKRPAERAVDETAGWQSSLHKGSLPVLFAWCFGIVAGAAPFVISGQLGVLHALFESISGWTTTGFSVVADVTAMPRVFLFHRSFMQYCGGLGFILMILLLVGGKQAVNLYNAEGHPERLMPNLRRTVRVIVYIYLGFLLLGTALYTIFGMELFDSVCHTMSALSTAGFTTQANSIGQYGSYAIEVVTILLMLIGATNFAVLLLLAKFKFVELFKVSELRFMLGLIAVTSPLVGLSLAAGTGMGLLESLHQAVFGIVTVFTTTGYSTMNYAAWPPFSVGVLIVLMVIGGCIGSTAGGIKLGRTYLLLRITRAHIQKKLSPSRRVTVQSYYRSTGMTPIDDALILDTFGFICCYVLVLIAGTLLITLTEGCSLLDALFEFASAFGTVGISNGVTNPGAAAGTLIVEMVGMVLGRLEIYIVFIGIFAALKKLRAKLPKRRGAL